MDYPEGYDPIPAPVNPEPWLFWRHVRGYSDVHECWEWQGAIQRGYGCCSVSLYGTSRPHVYVYWELVNPDYEPQQDEYDLDHLCNNRKCCNPNHLVLVSRQENLLRSETNIVAINARKTHCPRGHEYDKINAQGRRCCRTCDRETLRRSRAKRKGL